MRGFVSIERVPNYYYTYRRQPFQVRFSKEMFPDYQPYLERLDNRSLQLRTEDQRLPF
jgi:hypothetical protein